MAFGRETVGAAYVRILADTTSLHDEIDRAMRDEADNMERHGEEHATRYDEGVKRGLERHEGIGDLIDKDLHDVTADAGVRGKLLGDEWSKGFRESMDRTFGKEFDTKFIDRWHEILVQDIRDSDIHVRKLNDDEVALSGTIKGPLLKAQQQVRREMQDAAYRTYADNIQAASDNVKELEGNTRKLHQANQELDKHAKKMWADFANGTHKSDEDLRKLVNRLRTAGGPDVIHNFDDIGNKFREMARSTGYAERDIDRFLENLRSHLHDTDNTITDTHRDWGKFFGKGSRNDFMNFFGSVMGKLLQFSETLAKPVADAFVQGLQQISGGLDDLSQKTEGFMKGPLSGLSNAFGGMAEGLSGSGGLIPLLTVGLPIALGVVYGALGTLTSAVWLAVGAITALASAIGVGLVGALGAVAPIGAAGLGAIGVFVLALKGLKDNTGAAQKELKRTNTEVENARLKLKEATPGTKDYTKAQKDLTKALKDRRAAQQLANQGMGKMLTDLKNWFKESSKIAAVHMFKNFNADWKLVQPALKGVQGLIRRIADAEGKVLDGFAKMLHSPAFAQFIQAADKYFPRIISKLGDALTQAFSGVMGVLRALMPWADKLAGAIDDLATKFNNWANSAKGQNAIQDFMKVAWQAAKDLWKIIVQVGRVIGEVFFSGTKHGGESLLGGIADSFQRLADYLASPKGKKAMEKWFEDARKFAHNLGGAINSIGRFLNGLDSPQHRKWAEHLGNAIQDVIDILIVLMDIGALVEGIFVRAGKALKVPEWFHAIKDGLKALDDLISGKWSKLPDDMKKLAEDTIKLYLKPFLDLWNKIKGPLEKFGKAVVEWFKKLPKKIVDALKDVGKKVGEFFADLPHKALNTGKAAAAWSIEIPIWLLGAALALEWGLIRIQARVIIFFARLPIEAIKAAGHLGSLLVKWITDAIPGAAAAVATLVGRIGHFFAGLPTKIGHWFQQLPGVIGRWLSKAVRTAGQKAQQIVSNIGSWLRGLPGKVSSWVSSLPGIVGRFMQHAASNALTWAHTLVSNVGSWLAGLPGKVANWLANLPSTVATKFQEMYNRAKTWVTNLVSDIGGWFSGIVGNITGALSGVYDAIVGPFQSAWDTVSGLVGKVQGALSHIGIGPVHLSSGGILLGATAIGGESGPEAVVPLNRPLAMVNPSVRGLSAFAQGKTSPIDQQPGKKVEQHITVNVYPRTENTEAIAQQVVNRAVALARV